MATVVATFFESCVSREILCGDRAGLWLEVLAQVASAGAAAVGGRAGGGTEVAGVAAGRRSAAGCSDRARGQVGARGGGAAEPSHPHPRSGTPPETRSTPVPRFSLSKLWALGGLPLRRQWGHMSKLFGN